MKLINVNIANIVHSDVPDYVDAYIDYAEHEDGTSLTEEELEAIPSDVVYDYIIDYIY